MAINKTTTDLSTLKINYLSQQMYKDALENDEIKKENENKKDNKKNKNKNKSLEGGCKKGCILY